MTVDDTAASVCWTGATLWDDVGACVAALVEFEAESDEAVSDEVPFAEHESPEKELESA